MKTTAILMGLVSAILGGQPIAMQNESADEQAITETTDSAAIELGGHRWQVQCLEGEPQPKALCIPGCDPGILHLQANGSFAWTVGESQSMAGQWTASGLKLNLSTSNQQLFFSIVPAQSDSRHLILVSNSCAGDRLVIQLHKDQLPIWLWPAVLTGSMLLLLLAFTWYDIRSTKRKERVLD